MIEEDVIAAEYRPPTAITSPAQIDGLVAISDLPVNQVVVSNQFVSQAESLSTFSSLLKNNEVAITISIDQVRGVAGLLVPAHFVNMLVAVSGSGAPDGEEGAQTGGCGEDRKRAGSGKSVSGCVALAGVRHITQKNQ